MAKFSIRHQGILYNIMMSKRGITFFDGLFLLVILLQKQVIYESHSRKHATMPPVEFDSELSFK